MSRTSFGLSFTSDLAPHYRTTGATIKRELQGVHHRPYSKKTWGYLCAKANITMIQTVIILIKTRTFSWNNIN